MTSHQIKDAVRKRDGFRCVQCQMTRKQHHDRYGFDLDVHRLEPGSKYTIDGCVTVCRSCHGPQPKSGRRNVKITLTAHQGISLRLIARYLEETTGKRTKASTLATQWVVEQIDRLASEAFNHELAKIKSVTI
jgi:5-methylcytosine-specific restriction endonuclease McrA